MNEFILNDNTGMKFIPTFNLDFGSIHIDPDGNYTLLADDVDKLNEVLTATACQPYLIDTQVFNVKPGAIAVIADWITEGTPKAYIYERTSDQWYEFDDGSEGGAGGVISIMNVGKYNEVQKIVNNFYGTTTEYPVLEDTQKNISSWTKNTTFPTFDNTYNSGENHLVYQGGSGFERFYTTVTVTEGQTTVFEFDFKTTGYNCSYGGNYAYAFIMNKTPEGTTSPFLQMSGVEVSAALDGTPSSETKHYTLTFTTVPGTYYIGFDFGYIVDGVETQMDINNISCKSIDVNYHS